MTSTLFTIVNRADSVEIEKSKISNIYDCEGGYLFQIEKGKEYLLVPCGEDGAPAECYRRNSKTNNFMFDIKSTLPIEIKEDKQTSDGVIGASCTCDDWDPVYPTKDVEKGIPVKSTQRLTITDSTGSVIITQGVTGIPARSCRRVSSHNSINTSSVEHNNKNTNI